MADTKTNMTIDEILAAASPRPWGLAVSGTDSVAHYYVEDSEGNVILDGPYIKDVMACVKAVNSYERQRQTLLRVIDAPNEPDKWLSEVYAALGIERPTATERKAQLAMGERQRECIATLSAYLAEMRDYAHTPHSFRDRVDAALARAKELLAEQGKEETT